METPAAGWIDSYNINVISVVRLIQKLLPDRARTRLGTNNQHLQRCGHEAVPGNGRLLRHQSCRQQSHCNPGARGGKRQSDHQYSQPRRHIHP